MALEIQVAAIGLAGALIGGAISSFTTWRIAVSERHKFARDRLWDLRREAYMNVIGALYQAGRLATHMSERYADDAHAFDESADKKLALKQFGDSFDDAQLAFTRNMLLLSPAFTEAFEKMLRELGQIADNPNLAPPEAADMLAEQMEPKIMLLTAMAQDEIRSGGVNLAKRA